MRNSLTAMTDRQARFVQEYLVDGCGTQAAIRSGVAPSGAHVWGSRTVRITKVVAVLQARQAEDAARLSIQRNDVLNGLLQAAEMAKLQCDPAGMVAAWKQVGHLMGFYSPERIKVDMSVQGQTVVNQLERLSDAELLALMASGGGAAAH